MSKPTLEEYLAEVKARWEAAPAPLSFVSSHAPTKVFLDHVRTDVEVLRKMVETLMFRDSCHVELLKSGRKYDAYHSARDVIKHLVPEEKP